MYSKSPVGRKTGTGGTRGESPAARMTGVSEPSQATNSTSGSPGLDEGPRQTRREASGSEKVGREGRTVKTRNLIETEVG